MGSLFFFPLLIQSMQFMHFHHKRHDTRSSSFLFDTITMFDVMFSFLPILISSVRPGPYALASLLPFIPMQFYSSDCYLFFSLPDHGKENFNTQSYSCNSRIQTSGSVFLSRVVPRVAAFWGSIAFFLLLLLLFLMATFAFFWGLGGGECVMPSIIDK